MQILYEKWDTIRFLDFDSALVLALSLQFFVSEPYIVNYYKSRMKYINDFCKKVLAGGTTTI